MFTKSIMVKVSLTSNLSVFSSLTRISQSRQGQYEPLFDRLDHPSLTEILNPRQHTDRSSKGNKGYEPGCPETEHEAEDTYRQPSGGVAPQQSAKAFLEDICASMQDTNRNGK